MLRHVFIIFIATVSALSTNKNTSTLAPESSTATANSSATWTITHILTLLGICVAVLFGIISIPAAILAIIELRKRYRSRQAEKQAAEQNDTVGNPDNQSPRHSRPIGEDDTDGKPESESFLRRSRRPIGGDDIDGNPVSDMAGPMDTNEWKKAIPDPLKHFSDVEKMLPIRFKKYFISLGIKDRDIGKIIEGCDPKIDFELAAREVFINWRNRKADEASLNALVDAFVECEFNKQCETLRKKWTEAGRDFDEQIEDQDIFPIIDEFNQADLRKLFCNGLKIRKRDVEIHMGTGTDAREQIMRLLNDWQMKNPQGTLEDLLNAFGDNKDAKLKLSKKWRNPDYNA